MTSSQFLPGAAIIFHGGYSAARCPICQFTCGFRYSGMVLDRYTFDHHETGQPEEHWVALLSTGSRVYGYPDQYESAA